MFTKQFVMMVFKLQKTEIVSIMSNINYKPSSMFTFKYIDVSTKLYNNSRRTPTKQANPYPGVTSSCEADL